MTQVCSFAECGRPRHCKGLCQGHYTQARRGQELTPLKVKARAGTPLADRITLRVKHDKATGCILWQGAKNPKGYGTIQDRGRTVDVHKAAYEAAHGEVPDGMMIDHRCYSRNCVNTQHMRVVTRAQNGQNRDDKNVRASTGLRGVYRTRSGRFQAQARVDGRILNGGTYDTPEEANEAAISLRMRFFTHSDGR